MTLLCAVFAAVVSTAVWYTSPSARELGVGLLCWMLWGASCMWLADAVFGYIELGAACFTPEPGALLNDLFLGLSVIALALVIWVTALLIRDPKGVVRGKLAKK